MYFEFAEYVSVFLAIEYLYFSTQLVSRLDYKEKMKAMLYFCDCNVYDWEMVIK